MTSTAEERAGVTVHEPGKRSLDGIFRLIEVAGQPGALPEVLGAMCVEVAAIAGTDVASVYVREGEGGAQVFTLRANVGFPAEAVGRVRLRVGEGITGFVADRLRPVSVAMAERDEHFKYVPGLGEERFPALLAVPVMRAGAAAGVLVLQRREASPFSDEEVVLATAVAAVISHAFERAEQREHERTQQASRGAARLRGTALSGGVAMGRAQVLPTLAALAASGAVRGADRVAVGVALGRLEADLKAAASRVGGPAGRDLMSLSLILDDRRFRKRLEEASAAAAPLEALSELARDYARAPFRGGSADGVELLAGRAAEIEDLCLLVHEALGDRPLVRAGSIVVADRPRAFLTLYAIAHGASAFVIEGEVPDPGAVTDLVRAAGLPLLASARGLFAWVRPGDLLVVDADAGTVRVNPEATAVARFRTERKKD